MTVNITLLKATVALTAAAILFGVLILTSRKQRAIPTALQLAGTSCLVVVALTHICEALHLLPWMGWGAPESAGHYVDLAGASLGLSLLAIGYLLRVLARR